MADYFSTTALPDILHKLDGSPTSIDLLRMRGSSIDKSFVLEADGTFQDEILDQLATGSVVSTVASESSSSEQPFIQILFLSSIRDNHDGFYHYFENWNLGPLHLWFTYDIFTKSTTYLLIDCPEIVKMKIKSRASNGNRNFLFQPFSIDFLIAEECASWREVFINTRWKKLFEWHDLSSNRMDPPIRTKVLDPENLQSLHALSRTWSMLYQDLGDLSSRLEFLITACSALSLTSPSNPKPIQTSPAISAFNFLLSRTNLRRRWVTSFSERTKLISEFVYNLAAQEVNKAALENARENRRNSQTNVKIQGLTAKIAEETAKDNSSMITIATMTMLFLPGTFISAIFSMVFFNFGSSGSSFDVSPWVWLYPAVTIPLTGLVFGWYIYWSRRREMKVPSQNGHAT